MKIAIVNHSHHPHPAYQTLGSAGMDIYAFLSEEVVLQPLERTLIATGIHIALPNGTEAQVRPRSGMAIKQGITCLNSPGTIDSDYRGEIKIILINLSNEAQTIRDGDRIAQLVIAKYEIAEWQAVADIEQTQRGIGGFGSTGT
jgi:dUTP pyrophosphatase